MAHKSVIEFLEASAHDQSLRDELAKIIGAGDGDISSAQELDAQEAEALLGQRGVLAARCAEQHGYAFTVAELNAVIRAFRQYQVGRLSETEFSRALGLDDALRPQKAGLTSVGKTIDMVYLGLEYAVEKNQHSAHQVLDFMKKTSEDFAFREELRKILNVGDGDISDFSELDADEMAALKSERGAVVAEFAARHGFLFTLADLLAVSDVFRRVQAGELCTEEFEKFLNLEVRSSDYFPFIENVVSMTYKGVKYATPLRSSTVDSTLPVVRFMERTGSDLILRDQLKAILGGDGDISEPGELDLEELGALRSDRSKQVVELGAENGFRFSVSDLGAVVGAFQLVNTGELSMESCVRILGLGKADALSGVKNTAQMIYRGVRR